MRLSYSVLLVLAIVCLALSEGASAGHGRRLKGILTKFKKKKTKALLPAITTALPEIEILKEVVVGGDWLPVDYEEPVATVEEEEEEKYVFDGTLYYCIYEDLIGKFFFKDSTKFYTVLFDPAVIPTKTFDTTEDDPGKVVVVEDEEEPDSSGGGSVDAIGIGGVLAKKKKKKFGIASLLG